MGRVSAQVSLYPLRRGSIGPVIREAVRCFEEQGLSVRVGEMSTLIWGKEHPLFSAVQKAFHQAAEHGDVVMSVTFSNTCPEPSEAS